MAADAASGTRILVINGHPDPGEGRFVHALASSYAAGAREAGHVVDLLHVGALEFPLLRSKDDWEQGRPCPDIAAAQLCIQRAHHIVLLYPLWLGDMPAVLKGFLEQVLRPGFAFGALDGKGFPEKKLRGKTARIVVTMGMPGFVYRWYYRAHSLKSLSRNILAFCGIGRIRSTLVGMVEGENASERSVTLRKLHKLGREAR